eukprot:scaffold54977_cov48-Prasinocladus_malaysianus.AAC.1
MAPLYSMGIDLFQNLILQPRTYVAVCVNSHYHCRATATALVWCSFLRVDWSFAEATNVPQQGSSVCGADDASGDDGGGLWRPRSLPNCLACDGRSDGSSGAALLGSGLSTTACSGSAGESGGRLTSTANSAGVGRLILYYPA